jgi:4-hydroxy-tetrahydrodipicolinate synthase
MVRRPGPRLSASDVSDIQRLVQRQDKRLQALGAAT